MSIKQLTPGLILACLVAGISFAIESLVSTNTTLVISPLVVAMLIGILASNFDLAPKTCVTGTRFAARSFLRTGIVLLGFQLSLQNIQQIGNRGVLLVIIVVTMTFFGTQWLGKKLGLSRPLSLLVATGFSICGASAIAAMRPISEADDDETAYAISLVTLCGTLAIFTLPMVGQTLSFTGVGLGSWIGASVHDVAQTIATAASGTKETQNTAVIVKLMRVMLLAPLVAGVSFQKRRTSRNLQPDSTAKHPPLVPLFIVGFIITIALNSAIGIPASVLRDIKYVEKFVLACALFGLGYGVNITKFRQIGPRPLALGLISWLLVAIVSATGVVVLNIG